MHSALLLPEIIHEICDSCIDEEYEESRRSLVSLAATCISFKNPSLDLLWSSVPARAFFYVLPARTLEYGNLALNIYTGRRELNNFDRSLVTNSEWDLFHVYSRRVRKLELNDALKVDLPVLNMLFPTRAHVEDALPRLTHLYLPVPSGTVYTWDGAPVFLVKTLRSVCLFSFFSDAPGFITSLVESTPTLASLTIYVADHDNWKKRFATACSQTVSQLHHLVEYDGPAFLPQLQLGLASLPSLTRVALDMVTPFSQRIAPAPGSLAFPSLSELKIHTDSIEHLVGFLGGISDDTQAFGRSKPLSLTLSTLTSLSTGEFHNLCTFISSFSRFRLCSFDFSAAVHSTPGADQEGETLALKTIQPLLRCVSLKVIALDFGTKFVSFDDDDIAEMANAWPDLEIFKINERTHWGTTSQITLHGLRSFLHACPRLSEVSMCMRIDDSERIRPEWHLTELDRMAKSRYGRALVKLNLLDSVIDASVHVFSAIVLSRLAPNVTVTITSPGPQHRIAELVKEAKLMCWERDGCIGAWTWDELDGRLKSIGAPYRFKRFEVLGRAR
ncbi:hypothetical protein CONPUDRAFT_72041 [Coniophora puteana RWD-64-598 SS2]|uniref:F-box domain-containing protein n=1 Tax=Coniophora puteana (strain RWD-64-598) TaxID=741705 RepID=A0A5M3MWG3_CONPW|nr:uncharacterized protein CONPUDRAFT_72041 [Coniophora puteana RWD-64-598 SS2]EIW83502.1 hypothetical protein CONPUDRAFT_72041 [Coniophora puteana RWD-64-598 SS2]